MREFIDSEEPQSACTCEEHYHVGCDSVKSGRSSTPMFRKDVLPQIFSVEDQPKDSPIKILTFPCSFIDVSLKLQWFRTYLHGVTSIALIAVRKSNPA
jgi:hypothetical protein